jgi:23S rRNA (adenine2030-N6)-methyltransferase
MLSYQHAYHAGNAADLHKHAALAALLTALTVKERGITYMESHAGRALYDLSSPEAEKTGEAKRAVGAVSLQSGALAEILTRTRAEHGPSAYPGSPEIARRLLRPQDRIVLCELHKGEAAALKAAMRGRSAEVHLRDGYEGLLALSPPNPRRRIVLIDPPYELKDEYGRVADFVPVLMKKWPEASVLVWYPVLPDGRQEKLVSALLAQGARRSEARFTPTRPGGMGGSGLLLFNAPYGAEDSLGAGFSAAPGILSRGPASP